jgi:hypothetical protein
MSKAAILKLAQQMLDRNLGIIEGCEAICRQRPTLEHSDVQADVLLPFIGFDSEMHSYPTGESRKYWNTEALRVQNERIRVIVAASEPEIFNACRILLARWGTRH